MIFNDLPLHDATLYAVHLKWAEQFCVLELDTVTLEKRKLIFRGVTDVHISRINPWGPSNSVNAVRQCDEVTYEIEIQSGDVLRIQASSWQIDANGAM